MTASVSSAVFLTKYDFTGISSVPGISVVLKNKTVPNQTLSWRKGMMGLLFSHTAFFLLSHGRRRAGERWIKESFQPWWGCISTSGVGDIVRIDGITNADSTDRFEFIMLFLLESVWLGMVLKFWSWVQTWILQRHYRITWTEKEIKDSLCLMKNSGKYWRKRNIIYQKITEEKSPKKSSRCVM